MTNNNNQLITSTFMNREFQSIRVDGVDQYPVQTLPIDPTGNIGFPVRQNEVSQDIKRILDKDTQSVKISKHLIVSINPKKVVCLSHDGLAELVAKTARKGCEFSWVLLEASFNTELKRANDHARGCLEKEEYYAQWRACREAGIKFRRLFTDTVKMQKELGFELNYGYMTLLVYQSTGLIEKYKAWQILYTTQKERTANPFRATLNQLELNQLGMFEQNAAMRANAVNIPIIQAIKETAEFFSY